MTALVAMQGGRTLLKPLWSAPPRFVRLMGVGVVAHRVCLSWTLVGLDAGAHPAHYVHMNARMHLSGAHGSQQPDGGDRIEVAARVLGLLADRTRLALLRRLGDGEADVTTLTECTDASRTSVSQHLARLRLAGLVTTRKEGRRVVYALRHGHLRRLVDEALQVADHQIGQLPPHD
ncbi:ArsR/SmtB family transcription factor [Actinomadura verrucosospora]